MFQIQLNEIYEKPHFEIAERYSYYIVQIFTASFYAYLAPIGILFLTVTFAVQYWVDKINLFRRSSALYDVDFVLSRNAIKLFESSLFVFAAGNFLFSMVMHHKYVNWVNVMGLVIAFVYVLVIVFMPTKIEKYFMDKEGYFPEHVTYSRCIKDKKFRQNYWTSNPATKFVKEIDPYTGKPNIAD